MVAQIAVRQLAAQDGAVVADERLAPQEFVRAHPGQTFRRDHHQRFLDQRGPGATLADGELRLDDDGGIQRAIGDLPAQLHRTARRHEHRQVRIALVEPLEHRRQHAGHGRAEDAEPELAQRHAIARRGQHVPHVPQQVARPVEHLQAGLGGPHRPARALHQRGADLGLQGLDARRDGRRRQIQAARGLRHGAQFHDRDEALHVARIHRPNVRPTTDRPAGVKKSCCLTFPPGLVARADVRETAPPSPSISTSTSPT